MDLEQLREDLDWAVMNRANPLADELQALGVKYAIAAGDPGRGIELMCEHFFERVASDLHPAGWAGVLAYAMRKSG